MVSNPIATEACVIVMYFFKGAVLIGLLSLFSFNLLSQNKIFNKFRELSFFAYAGHFLFCSILLHIIAPYFAFMHTGKQTLLTLIFVIFGVGFMWVVYFTGRRFCPGLMKVFDGNLKI